jgi:trans-2,3-dihydro-3-hydroxyanthranilate isomerase
MVPLPDVTALSRARLDHSRWVATLQGDWAQNVYLYVLVDGQEGDTVRVRMFSPALGVAEDPATGAAAAAFAGFMATLEPNRSERQWTITQGVEMGRPSTLLARVARRADLSTAVFVGGHGVRVSEGTLWL